MRLFLTFGLLLTSFAAASAWPAQQSRADSIRITAQTGGRFLLRQGNLQATLNLQASIQGCTTQTYAGNDSAGADTEYRVRVLDEVQKGGFSYVVVQVDTQSNCNLNGMCGAGQETDVLWLKLDNRLRLAAKQTENVASCATQRYVNKMSGKPREENAEGTPDLALKSGKLDLQSSPYNDSSLADTPIFTLRYDRNQPQRGLVHSQK